MANAQEITRQLKSQTNDSLKKIALDATANLIETTPVDLGWARANWIPSIGAPVDSASGDRENISQSDQQQGIAIIATSDDLVGQTIYITNNVPYIQRLNDGYSQQAPSGFVQSAVDRAIRDNQ